jgi:hypothetical protein
MDVIVILGMHRSGTSALTRALQLLGASLGPEEDLGRNWESRVMRGPSDELLRAFGGGWDCPPRLPPGWERSDAARAVVPSADAAVRRLGTPDVLAWKDPRACMTLPFWRDRLPARPVVVFVHRHPVEVADSLAARNGIRRALGHALWERYNVAALAGAAGLPTVVVPYPRLVEHPEATIRTVVDALGRWGVVLPRAPESTPMDLTPGRRHHNAETGDDLDDPVATVTQRELFATLRDLPSVSDAFEPPETPAPSPLSDEIVDLAAQLRLARSETWRAREELRKLSGSRGALLRRLVRPAPPRDPG